METKYLSEEMEKLRDAFAMAALTGLLADSNLQEDKNWFAREAYEYADKMIEAKLIVARAARQKERE